eukprot:496275-Rhodomonas_salina.1
MSKICSALVADKTGPRAPRTPEGHPLAGRAVGLCHSWRYSVRGAAAEGPGQIGPQSSPPKNRARSCR